MPLRYFSRFEKADGSEVVVFPTHRYEYEQQQSLQGSSANLVGDDYSHDQLGSNPSLKANATERVRFIDVADADDIDDDMDNFKRIVGWGVGKIVTTSAKGERWAWGRPLEVAQYNINVENRIHLPVIMTFERSSDFFALAHDESFNVSDPTTIEITNGGNTYAYDPVIIIKGPYTAPVITNNSVLLPGTLTPYKLESIGVGAASTNWLKFDARRNEILRSSDSGATWLDDSANYVRQDGQLRLMLFASGVNSLLVDNVAGDVEVLFTEAWH